MQGSGSNKREKKTSINKKNTNIDHKRSLNYIKYKKNTKERNYEID